MAKKPSEAKEKPDFSPASTAPASTGPDTRSSRDRRSGAVADTSKAVAVVDWQAHSKRIEVLKDGLPCELGAPFSGMKVKLIPLSHGRVSAAIAHAETVARRKAGLRGQSATPDAPNTPEVDQAVNLAAAFAGTRQVQARVRFSEDDIYHFEMDAGAKHLSEDDQKVWRSLLEDSPELVQRAVGIMRDLGRRSDDEILELHRTGGVFGRDLVAVVDQ